MDIENIQSGLYHPSVDNEKIQESSEEQDNVKSELMEQNIFCGTGSTSDTVTRVQ